MTLQDFHVSTQNSSLLPVRQCFHRRKNPSEEANILATACLSQAVLLICTSIVVVSGVVAVFATKVKCISESV